jgi:hypothetical protein
MDVGTVGDRLFIQWLRAHAALAGTAVLDDSETEEIEIDRIVEELHGESFPFCQIAVEEYHRPISCPSRTMHPRSLLLQQSSGHSASFALFAKEHRAVMLRPRCPHLHSPKFLDLHSRHLILEFQVVVCGGEGCWWQRCAAVSH